MTSTSGRSPSTRRATSSPAPARKASIYKITPRRHGHRVLQDQRDARDGARLRQVRQPARRHRIARARAPRRSERQGRSCCSIRRSRKFTRCASMSRGLLYAAALSGRPRSDRHRRRRLSGGRPAATAAGSRARANRVRPKSRRCRRRRPAARCRTGAAATSRHRQGRRVSHQPRRRVGSALGVAR